MGLYEAATLCVCRREKPSLATRRRFSVAAATVPRSGKAPQCDNAFVDEVHQERVARSVPVGRHDTRAGRPSIPSWGLADGVLSRKHDASSLHSCFGTMSPRAVQLWRSPRGALRGGSQSRTQSRTSYAEHCGGLSLHRRALCRVVACSLTRTANTISDGVPAFRLPMSLCHTILKGR